MTSVKALPYASTGLGTSKRRPTSNRSQVRRVGAVTGPGTHSSESRLVLVVQRRAYFQSTTNTAVGSRPKSVPIQSFVHSVTRLCRTIANGSIAQVGHGRQALLAYLSTRRSKPRRFLSLPCKVVIRSYWASFKPSSAWRIEATTTDLWNENSPVLFVCLATGCRQMTTTNSSMTIATARKSPQARTMK